MLLTNHWVLLLTNLQGGWCISQLCQIVCLHSRILRMAPIWHHSHNRSVPFQLLGFLYVRNVCCTQCRQFYILASILGPICQAICSWSRLCLQSWRMVVFGPWSFCTILNLFSSRVFFAIANNSLCASRFNILESGSPRKCCIGSNSWCKHRFRSLPYTKKNGVSAVAKFGVTL